MGAIIILGNICLIMLIPPQLKGIYLFFFVDENGYISGYQVNTVRDSTGRQTTATNALDKAPHFCERKLRPFSYDLRSNVC